MNERTKITADKKFSKQCAFVSSLNRTTANFELVFQEGTPFIKTESFLRNKKAAFLKGIYSYLICIYAHSSV